MNQLKQAVSKFLKWYLKKTELLFFSVLVFIGLGVYLAFPNVSYCIGGYGIDNSYWDSRPSISFYTDEDKLSDYKKSLAGCKAIGWDESYFESRIKELSKK
tara:strand:- start:65 stop:367 length:303 start_codon:yes stop_codon:yes gene_type:complete